MKLTDQPKVAVNSKGSLSEFWNDFEFISFLKNVALFCTSDDDDEAIQYLDQNQILYKNLEMLREKFQAFKRQKDKSETRSEISENEQQASLTQENESRNLKSNLEAWKTVRTGKSLS